MDIISYGEARKALAEVASSARVIQRTGSGWPARPDDDRPTIFVGGEAPAGAPDSGLRPGDMWVPGSPEDTASVAALIVEALADHATVVAAAAAAAPTAVAAEIAGRDLVERSDPGIPRVGEPVSTDFKQIWTGPNGEFIRGDRVDGSVEISRAILRAVQIAGGTIQAVDAEGLLWVPYLGPPGPEDRIPEICLDLSGQVPQWALERWKTRMGLGALNGPLDIVILAGQSNATQLSAATSVFEPAVQDVLEWNGTTFAELSGVPWLGSGFARRYAELHGRPEHRGVAVVKAAMGSTGFVGDDPTWDRTKTGAAANLYDQMIAKAQAALAAAPAGSRIVAVLWSQGENDRYTGLAAYQGKLDDLIAQTRTDLGIADLPFVISSLTPEIIRYGLSTSDTGAQAINVILEDTPRRLKNTSFVFGPEGMADPKAGENGMHWSSLGQTLRGKWMAEHGYDQARLNIDPTTTAQLLPPERLRISRSGGAAVIEWDSPTGRVTSFILETCTDGVGTTWSAETLANPLTHTHTKSVSAATPLWARIKSSNSESGFTSLTSKEVHA